MKIYKPNWLTTIPSRSDCRILSNEYPTFKIVMDQIINHYARKRYDHVVHHNDLMDAMLTDPEQTLCENFKSIYLFCMNDYNSRD
jgi:hypothetical protein